MSRETQPTNGLKLVPMTREQVENITAALSFAPGGEDLLDDLFAAYDAAPENAEEAVRPLVQLIASLRDPWDEIDATTRAILAALGVPVVSPPVGEDAR